MYRRRRINGFSLVDLLACLAIGGVFVALFWPAVQRTRERSRLVDCKDRLTTIAKATLDFHDAFMRLPPGTLNYASPPDGIDAARAKPGLSADECQNLGALFLILPFIELRNGDEIDGIKIHDSVDGRLADLKEDLREITDASEPPQRIFNSQLRYGPGAGVNFPADSFIQLLFDDDMGPSGVATEEIPSFNCPADTLNAESELPSIAITMPYFNGTSLYSTPLDGILNVMFRDMELAKTNYVAIAGTTSCMHVPSRLAKWAGAMSGREPRTMEQISNLDGVANTFLFGESLGDVGRIAKVKESGEFEYCNSDGFEPGKRFITRSWVWGGIAILASSNFPWGCMQHPDVQNGERRYMKLLGDSYFADPESLSSAHEEGVNFAMSDGSVHTVPRNIAWQLYYGNGGLRDGITERGF